MSSLDDELQSLRAASLARLDPADRVGLRATIELLGMMQIAEHSLQPGDTLPDFALPHAEGRVITSDGLLDRGPLVLAFFRGGWCPYCDCTLRALERIRPALEAIPVTLAGVAPCTPAELARVAAEKGLGFPLLSDTAYHPSLLDPRLEAGEEVVSSWGGRRAAWWEGLRRSPRRSRRTCGGACRGSTRSSGRAWPC